MCTAVPPPSPPRPPKYVPKDPPTPPKPTVHGPYSAKTLQLIRDNHGGGVQYFVDGVLNCRAMYRFAVCGCTHILCTSSPSLLKKVALQPYICMGGPTHGLIHEHPCCIPMRPASGI